MRRLRNACYLMRRIWRDLRRYGRSLHTMYGGEEWQPTWTKLPEEDCTVEVICRAKAYMIGGKLYVPMQLMKHDRFMRWRPMKRGE